MQLSRDENGKEIRMDTIGEHRVRSLQLCYISAKFVDNQRNERYDNSKNTHYGILHAEAVIFQVCYNSTKFVDNVKPCG